MPKLISQEKNKNRWKVNSRCVFNLSYHIIFCPKYRRRVLVNPIDIRLKELITQKCAELNVEIIAMEVMTEHVHLFVKTPPTLSPHIVVGQIKGFSSKILREEFPDLKKKLPCLWSPSYYIDSVGILNEFTIKNYVDNQKNH
jgi:putative transposase